MIKMFSYKIFSKICISWSNGITKIFPSQLFDNYIIFLIMFLLQLGNIFMLYGGWSGSNLKKRYYVEYLFCI